MSRRKDDYACNRVSEIVAVGIIKEHERKKSTNNNFVLNREIYDAGTNWFFSGLALEDADEELKNNQNFINGYNRGKRLSAVAEYQYNTGVECYDSGMTLEEVAQKYSDTPMVLKGYEDAMINSQTRK